MKYVPLIVWLILILLVLGVFFYVITSTSTNPILDANSILYF